MTGRSVFVPGGGRVAGAPLAGQRQFLPNRFFFGHHHFRNFVFVAGQGWIPYDYDYPYSYGGCWQQVLTGDGWQWTNAC
jgi:hypothetical protein